MPRLLLLGMTTSAYAALKALTSKFDVVGIVRQESEPQDSVADLARTLTIPIFPDISLKGVRDVIQHQRPDIGVVCTYDRLLPSDILDLCPFINVHYADLPRLRGRAVVNWALINNDPHTAITIHLVVPGLDAGRILYQQRVPIGPRDTVANLYASLDKLLLENLAASVEDFLKGDPGKLQIKQEATYACSRNPEDGEIDWDCPTDHIDRLIRALVDPFPGAFTYHLGKKLTVVSAEPVEIPLHYVGRIPGRIVKRSARDGFVDVLTRDGILRIYKVRLGKEIVPASKIVRSVRDTMGLRLGDLLNRIAELEERVEQLTNASDRGTSTFSPEDHR